MEDNIYEFLFDENHMLGVYAVSLVSTPAIEIDFMKFAKEQPQEWKMASAEKRILTSPVLIPNQKIFRNNIQGESGYVFASEQTISQLQQNFAKQKYSNQSALEHETPIDDVYFFESWIVEDPKNDKSNALGFSDLPKGTWMMSMKVDNDDIWNRYISTGEIKGFSIDGQLATKKIDNNKKINNLKMNKQTIQEIVLSAIKSVALASDLVEFKDADGKSYYASELAVGSIVTDVDGNLIVDADFVIEDKKYSTDEMGAIKEIEDVVADEAPVEDVVVEELADEVPVDAPVEDAPVVDKDAKIADLEAQVADLEAKNLELEAQLSQAEEANVQMSRNTPASEGFVDKPVNTFVSNKNETLIETLRRLRA